MNIASADSRPVALVTGASAGIGTAFARALAARGYDLVLTARRLDRLQTLAAELRASGAGRVVAIATDLAESGSVGKLAEDVENAGFTVDLLLNNAGFGYHGDFASSDPAMSARMVTLNVASLVDLSRTFVAGMVARGHGGIINVASTAAFQPVPAMAVYGATKAFVLSFSEALHEEVRRRGVRVVALCPGATDTEFFGIAGDGAAIGPRRDVRSVVRTGLRALDRNRAVAIDGLANATLAESIRFMPRSIVARMSARLMGSA